jgi:hypothetical protein
MSSKADIQVLRELTRQYVEVTQRPAMDERRARWRRLHDRQPGTPLVLVNFGMWNVWCREVFGDDRMACRDPFYRGHERVLRMLLFHATLNDDYVFEPWLTQGATQAVGWNNIWGVETSYIRPGVEGGAWKFDPVLREEADLAKLRAPPHRIDEAQTARDVARLHEAVGDLIAIDVNRNPACLGFMMDISTKLCHLRGLEQVMLDMIERPAWLHQVLAFMRDGILANQAAAVAEGDLSLTAHRNQALPYCPELPRPAPNARPARLAQLWGFCAAQEFTGVSPAMHDEFLVQYQLPILRQFGLAAYGCCEDLTRKIDMLRQIPNLRRIAVTPVANLPKCAAQVGREYVLSWRPNPTNMVCCGFDETAIRRILSTNLQAAHQHGCCLDVTLKDIETVEGDTGRLARWVQLVREEAGRLWQA